MGERDPEVLDLTIDSAFLIAKAERALAALETHHHDVETFLARATSFVERRQGFDDKGQRRRATDGVEGN